MLKHFIGLTSTLEGVLNRQIALSLLLNTDTRFAFSCHKDHVISADRNLVPMEATWFNSDRIGERDPDSRFDKRPRSRPARHGNQADSHQMVSYDAVDEANHDRLEVFMAAVSLADSDGRVQWKIGNQLAFMGQLEEGEWFWQGEWHVFEEKEKA